MPDNVSAEKRKWIMSRVRSKGSKCERALRGALVRAGAKGFRMHYSIVGTPDFVFPEYKLAVFCDSAFWHGHRPLPTSNVSYWHPKISHNRARDRTVTRQLKEQGWMVLRLREAEILRSPSKSAREVIRYLANSTRSNQRTNSFLKYRRLKMARFPQSF